MDRRARTVARSPNGFHQRMGAAQLLDAIKTMVAAYQLMNSQATMAGYSKTAAEEALFCWGEKHQDAISEEVQQMLIELESRTALEGTDRYLRDVAILCARDIVDAGQWDVTIIRRNVGRLNRH